MISLAEMQRWEASEAQKSRRPVCKKPQTPCRVGLRLSALPTIMLGWYAPSMANHPDEGNYENAIGSHRVSLWQAALPESLAPVLPHRQRSRASTRSTRIHHFEVGVAKNARSRALRLASKVTGCPSLLAVPSNAQVNAPSLEARRTNPSRSAFRGLPHSPTSRLSGHTAVDSVDRGAARSSQGRFPIERPQHTAPRGDPPSEGAPQAGSLPLERRATQHPGTPAGAGLTPSRRPRP